MNPTSPPDLFAVRGNLTPAIPQAHNHFMDTDDILDRAHTKGGRIFLAVFFLFIGVLSGTGLWFLGAKTLEKNRAQSRMIEKTGIVIESKEVAKDTYAIGRTGAIQTTLNFLVPTFHSLRVRVGEEEFSLSDMNGKRVGETVRVRLDPKKKFGAELVDEGPKSGERKKSLFLFFVWAMGGSIFLFSFWMIYRAISIGRANS